MLTESHLVREFITLVERTYPQVGSVLRQCHIKLVTAHWGEPPRRLDYMAIYCPESSFAVVCSHKQSFHHISHYMGLADPVCVNATRLLRDPHSKLKQEAPRFWLELHQLLPAQRPEPE